MYNEILKIGPVTIHGYGLMIGIGILCALFCGLRLAKKKGLVADEIYNLTILCAISGFACGKILYCIVEWRVFVNDPLAVLGSDGFVVYGGIIGATLFSGLYCRIRRLDFFKYFDVVLPAVAVAQGFGRIGCFLAGCCYGKETDSFIGVVFTHSDYAPNGVPLYPTQLLSSVGCFLMAAVLFIYLRKERKPGSAGSLYLIIYSIGRSLIEFLRGDLRGTVGILSTSQFISIFVLIIGIVLFILSQKGMFIRKSQDTH